MKEQTNQEKKIEFEEYIKNKGTSLFLMTKYDLFTKAQYNSKVLLFLVNTNGHGDRLNYINKISKFIGCTYSHACKIINYLEKEGFLTTAKKGRFRKVQLTNKGRRVALLVHGLAEEINK